MLTVDVGHLRNLLQKLRDYNERIAKQDDIKYQSAQTVTNLKADLDQVMYAIKFDVEQATIDNKPDGKKKFSNKEIRDAETARRLSINDGAKRLQDQIADAERTKHEADSYMYKLMEDRRTIKLEINVETAILNALADPATRSMIDEQDKISSYKG